MTPSSVEAGRGVQVGERGGRGGGRDDRGRDAGTRRGDGRRRRDAAATRPPRPRRGPDRDGATGIGRGRRRAAPRPVRRRPVRPRASSSAGPLVDRRRRPAARPRGVDARRRGAAANAHTNAAPWSSDEHDDARPGRGSRRRCRASRRSTGCPGRAWSGRRTCSAKVATRQDDVGDPPATEMAARIAPDREEREAVALVDAGRDHEEGEGQDGQADQQRQPVRDGGRRRSG